MIDEVCACLYLWEYNLNGELLVVEEEEEVLVFLFAFFAR